MVFTEKPKNSNKPNAQEAKPSPEELQRRYLRKRRFLRIGQAVMLIGALVAVNHWLAHTGLYGQQPAFWLDWVAGYPMGGLLIVVGAMITGRK